MKKRLIHGEMNAKYSYKLRSAYNSSDLLIEFIKVGNSDLFLKELITLLKENGFQYEGTSDIWMNDEVWVHLTSSNGKIIITKDIWDFIFILSEKNQKDIKIIDEILRESDVYEKESPDVF